MKQSLNAAASPYLVALNIDRKPAVVVGGGTVATRKVSGLLVGGAAVTVISPQVSDDIRALSEQSQVHWHAADYASGLLAAYHPVLVIAATDHPHINQQVRQDARQLGAWVNDVSAPEEADFYNMALIERSPIQVGISTGGASPALLRWLKKQLEHVIDEPLGILATWLHDLRAVAADLQPAQKERQRLYERILASDVLQLLRSGQPEAARQRFDSIVQERRS